MFIPVRVRLVAAGLLLLAGWLSLAWAVREL